MFLDTRGWNDLSPPLMNINNQLKLNPTQVQVCYASDLHLDFGDVNDEFFDVIGDVLILAGDIVEIKNLPRIKEFLKRCSENWSWVLWVAGNHEYYGGSFPGANDKLREALKEFQNIVFLQNEAFEYKGVWFLGATLWTDLGGSDPLAIMNAERLMNDYRVIRQDNNGYRRLQPSVTIQEHHKSKDFFGKYLKSLWDKPCVVISHHAPTSKSIHPAYADRHLDNLNYFSDLSGLILEHKNLTHWIHGHVHFPADYRVGSCNVLCNPRGYPGERPGKLAPYQPQKFVIEI